MRSQNSVKPTGEGERGKEAALPLSMDDQFAAISSPSALELENSTVSLAEHAHAVMSLLSAVPFREQHPANLLKRAHSIKGSMAKATLLAFTVIFRDINGLSHACVNSDGKCEPAFTL